MEFMRLLNAIVDEIAYQTCGAGQESQAAEIET
jgi:hypothetical protein